MKKFLLFLVSITFLCGTVAPMKRKRTPGLSKDPFVVPPSKRRKLSPPSSGQENSFGSESDPGDVIFKLLVSHGQIGPVKQQLDQIGARDVAFKNALYLLAGGLDRLGVESSEKLCEQQCIALNGLLEFFGDVPCYEKYRTLVQEFIGQRRAQAKVKKPVPEDEEIENDEPEEIAEEVIIDFLVSGGQVDSVRSGLYQIGARGNVALENALYEFAGGLDGSDAESLEELYEMRCVALENLLEFFGDVPCYKKLRTLVRVFIAQNEANAAKCLEQRMQQNIENAKQ